MLNGPKGMHVEKAFINSSEEIINVRITQLVAEDHIT
jgi:hypothetical protein